MMSGIQYKYIIVVTQIVYEIDILLYSNSIQHMQMQSHVYKHTHARTHARSHTHTHTHLCISSLISKVDSLHITGVAEDEEVLRCQALLQLYQHNP